MPGCYNYNHEQQLFITLYNTAFKLLSLSPFLKGVLKHCVCVFVHMWERGSKRWWSRVGWIRSKGRNRNLHQTQLYGSQYFGDEHMLFRNKISLNFRGFFHIGWRLRIKWAKHKYIHICRESFFPWISFCNPTETQTQFWAKIVREESLCTRCGRSYGWICNRHLLYLSTTV